MTDETQGHETPAGKKPFSPRAQPARVPITVRGQKYVAPVGRHSKQTHRLAEERAAAMGNVSEKEQHAQDRNAFVADLNRRADQKSKQKQQSDQNKLNSQPKPPTEQN